MMEKSISIRVHRRKITYALTLIVVFLSAGHILVHLPSALWGYSGKMFGLFNFFNLGVETSLATYVSALNFLLAGGLLSLIAYYESGRENGKSIYWWVLAFGFLVMSIDDAAEIHEGIVGPLGAYFMGQGEGLFLFSWTRVYIPVVILIFILFVPFLRSIGREYAIGFLLAGLVFIGGALGFEMVGSYIEAYDIGGGKYEGIRVLLEESFEMFGVVIFIHFVLKYISEKNISLNLIVLSQDVEQKTLLEH